MNDTKSFVNDNEIQLCKMKAHEHFVEAQVQEGDTLQAIALRFYCSISELKRINNIHKDNEIFARWTIKIPVVPYSILTEVTPCPSTPEPSTHKFHLKQCEHPEETVQPTNVSIKNAHKKNYATDRDLVNLNKTITLSVFPHTNIPNVSVLEFEKSQIFPKEKRLTKIHNFSSNSRVFPLKKFNLLFCVLVFSVVFILLYINKC